MKRIETVLDITPLGDEVGGEESIFYTFPSICTLSNGSLLCSALVGKTKSGPEGRIRLIRSNDGMRSWQPSASPSQADESDPLYGYIMCHLTETQPGRILAVYLRSERKKADEPLFHPKTDGMQRSQVRISFSPDFGYSWEKPHPLDFTLPDLIVPGKCIILPSGDLGIPCEVWHEWDRGWRQWPSSRLILSSDSGLSWPSAGIMAQDTERNSIYGDPRLTILPDGRLLALFWRYSLLDGKDFSVHRSISIDSGRNWEPPFAIPLEAQISCPVALSPGLTLCVYQKRFGDAAGVHAVLSYDECLHFDMATDTILWKSPKKTASQNPFSGYADFQFGYTTCLKESETDVLVSFWAGNGRTSCVKLLRLKVES
ncbi:MAG TPA: sialidase family protein [Spirochaetia bacterium]|nr:sialidase family protein [Spirochaetia bacterium]